MGMFNFARDIVGTIRRVVLRQTNRQFNFALNFGGRIDQDIVIGAAPPVPFGLALATEPSLAAFTLADAFDDGEPDLFAALRWDYGLCERLYGRDLEMENILAWCACCSCRGATSIHGRTRR